jgi:hypothetical protein
MKVHSPVEADPVEVAPVEADLLGYKPMVPRWLACWLVSLLAARVRVATYCSAVCQSAACQRTIASPAVASCLARVEACPAVASCLARAEACLAVASYLAQAEACLAVASCLARAEAFPAVANYPAVASCLAQVEASLAVASSLAGVASLVAVASLVVEVSPVGASPAEQMSLPKNNSMARWPLPVGAMVFPTVGC